MAVTANGGVDGDGIKMLGQGSLQINKCIKYTRKTVNVLFMGAERQVGVPRVPLIGDAFGVPRLSSDEAPVFACVECMSVENMHMMA